MSSNRNKDAFTKSPVWSRPIDQNQYFVDDEVKSILTELGFNLQPRIGSITNKIICKPKPYELELYESKPYEPKRYK
jgi:hypothetical protein